MPIIDDLAAHDVFLCQAGKVHKRDSAGEVRENKQVKHFTQRRFPRIVRLHHFIDFRDLQGTFGRFLPFEMQPGKRVAGRPGNPSRKAVWQSARKLLR